MYCPQKIKFWGEDEVDIWWDIEGKIVNFDHIFVQAVSA